jgi:hypothetical protein
MFGIRKNPDPALYIDPDQSSAINKVEIFYISLSLFSSYYRELINHTEEDTVEPSFQKKIINSEANNRT